MVNVFTHLLQKILPLYMLILLGVVGGRLLKVQKETIANLLIYILVPVVIFFGVLTVDLTPAKLFIPFIFFTLCCVISLCFFLLTRGFLNPSQRGILSYASGSANTGYFGLPLTIFLLGVDAWGLAILCAFGFIIYESSLGFYFVSRAHHGVRESVRRLLRLPSLYVFVIAIVLNFAGIKKLNDGYHELAENFRGAYTVLGMFLVGLGISHLKKWKMKISVTVLVFFFKFIIWPLVIGSLILCDKMFFHILDDTVHRVMFLMSLVPLPANAVAYASILNTEPEETAVLVLASTIFALVYIPFAVSLMP